MEMSWMSFGRLETRVPFAEVDLPGEAFGHHPLQRAVDRRATNAGHFAAHDRHQVVGADVPFLAKKHINDSIAFGGVFGLRRHLAIG